MILLLDNYDSFVHNLARYFRRFGCETKIVRSDQISIAEIESLKPEAIIISPGPCTPNESGVCLRVVTELSDRFPMLGICLGHQVIAQAFGGTVVRSEQPVHGIADSVFHHGEGLFRELPAPFQAARYHSLVVDPGSLPGCLKVTGQTNGGVVMAIQHVERPIFGLQFHPESVLSEFGFELLAEFLRMASLQVHKVPSFQQERIVDREPRGSVPASPVTF